MCVGCEADHSAPSVADAKNEWSYTPTSARAFMVTSWLTYFLSSYPPHLNTFHYFRNHQPAAIIFQNIPLPPFCSAHSPMLYPYPATSAERDRLCMCIFRYPFAVQDPPICVPVGHTFKNRQLPLFSLFALNMENIRISEASARQLACKRCHHLKQGPP